MTMSVKLGVPNGIFFIGDPQARIFPEDVDGDAGVWFTPEIVAVACLHDMEGHTQITIGAANELKPDGALVFDGIVQTPTRMIEVITVPQSPIKREEPVLIQTVGSVKTRVQVWKNVAKHADMIEILRF